MERYGGNYVVESPQVDPGVEEPMWRLGLAGGSESYPERPGEVDCIYYLRTGLCGYGPGCRFNHPWDRFAALRALQTRGGEYPERVGQPVCQYYMRTGICKFGASCKYNHPKLRVGYSPPFNLNYYGYPLRQGEKECPYYIKTGHCKFGVTCKFHHPEPIGVQVLPQVPGPGPLAGPSSGPRPTVYPTLQPSIQSSPLVPGNWPVPRPAMLPGSYAQGSYGPVILARGVVPVPGWTPYPAPVSHVASQITDPPVGAGPIYRITQLSASATAYTGPYLSITSLDGPSSTSQKEHAFPERPGLPECQYYLRTGDCKFGPTCKYHHPSDWTAPKTNFELSPMGLPLRPGASLCSHYIQHGVCKFGSSCKFDHPVRPLGYSPSASSLTDMPVAPYPVGSTNATMAPSSSSSDLRCDLVSGAQMSSMNSSSASVGSIFSKSWPVNQKSGQGSNSASGGA